MKAKLVIALSFGVLLTTYNVPRAMAEKPPVDVQASDDEDEDFFNDKPAKKEKAPEEKRAAPKASDEDKMFDKLNAMEKGVKIKRSKKNADNENTNQQDV